MDVWLDKTIVVTRLFAKCSALSGKAFIAFITPAIYVWVFVFFEFSYTDVSGLKNKYIKILKSYNKQLKMSNHLYGLPVMRTVIQKVTEGYDKNVLLNGVGEKRGNGAPPPSRVTFRVFSSVYIH